MIGNWLDYLNLKHLDYSKQVIKKVEEVQTVKYQILEGRDLSEKQANRLNLRASFMNSSIMQRESLEISRFSKKKINLKNLLIILGGVLISDLQG